MSAAAAGLGGTAYPEAELYDPGTDVFTPAGALAAARFWFAVTLLGDGRVLSIGGIIVLDQDAAA